MEQLNIFISVGATANDTQEKFVAAIEDKLKRENLIPNTVGRNKFTSGSPLKAINELMDECSGTIIVALERTFFSTGFEKRGGVKERQLTNTKYATPWNQIEAAMAYSKGLPLLLIIETELKSEGLLEEGYDWYVLWVDPNENALTTKEFNGVFSDWKRKVENYKKNQPNRLATEKRKVPLFNGNFYNISVETFWVALPIICSLAFFLGTIKYDADKISLSEQKKALEDTVRVREKTIKYIRHNSDSALNILGHMPYNEMTLDSLSFRKVQTTIENAGGALYLNR
ncbi:hypothetical protein P1X15_10170 [Runella sp. MFBS21]|uniref:hypothetical protein n=1 Tax=Runella sp. MFBS21 TaxID=3034018 RepID=UPI0023F90E38|nr:hypothetical protein [Runella sp. MFBS21]MDF7817964.1 hypothetical protein [Runella sp. MFBS21]